MVSRLGTAVEGAMPRPCLATGIPARTSCTISCMIDKNHIIIIIDIGIYVDVTM